MKNTDSNASAAVKSNIQNDERWETMYREAKAFVAYPNTKIELKDLRTAELVAEFALRILDLKQVSVDKQLATATDRIAKLEREVAAGKALLDAAFDIHITKFEDAIILRQVPGGLWHTYRNERLTNAHHSALEAFAAINGTEEQND